jgi:porin
MMRIVRLLCGVCLLVCAVPAVAQEEATESSETTASTVESGDAFTTWIQGDKMTGDWGGVRKELADKGITLDIDYTQILQGNAHGGAQTDNGFRASGSADVTLKLDTGKMGLWPGGQFLFNAEPHWGNGINSKVGSLSPANLDAFKPGEGCFFTLSEWIFQQVLFEGKVILIAGKLDGSRAFDRNAFANDERTQFLNASLRNVPMIPDFLPYTDIGAGIIVNPTDWLSVLTAVADSEGDNHRTGFDTTFHGPTHTTVIHEWLLKLKPFEKPGNYRVGFAWSSKEFEHLEPISPFRQTGPMLLDILGLDLFTKVGKYLPFNESPDNIVIYTNFDQYLYTEAEDPSQGIGLFGRFAWARQDVNPVNYFYSAGVGGKGIVPERDNDTYGIGYYHLDLSNRLPPIFHSEQGVECFYNFEITPWMHLTPDLQVIVNPGGTDLNDVAVVYGLRLQMNL